MTEWNFFPEGITPLPNMQSTSGGECSNHHGQTRKSFGKSKRKPSTRSARDHLPPMFMATIRDIHKIMKASRQLEQHDLNKVIELLDNCFMDDPVCTFQDDCGYDIVQRAVALNAIQILEHLVENKYDLRLNTRTCSSALFVAAKYRNTEIVQFLLRHGASVHHPSSPCYPRRHNMACTRRVGSSVRPGIVCSLPDDEILCDRGRFSTISGETKGTPMYTAVKGDASEILEILLQNRIKSRTNNFELLEFACNVGAMGCIGPLLRISVKHFQQPKAGGYSVANPGRFKGKPQQFECRPFMPFLQAAFGYSEECGLFLIDEACKCGLKNVVLNAYNFSTESYILHVVYYLIVHYFDVTKKIITAGFDTKNINKPDALGNSLLHILISQIGLQVSSQRRRPSVPKMSEEEVAKLEEERQEQLLATVHYLVNLGADIHMLNDTGETVLHKLVDSISHHGLRWSGESGLESAFIKIQPQINRLLEFLLRKGVDVNKRGPYTSTVLSQLINNLSMFAVSRLDSVWVHIWYTFNLLFKYNADPNIVDNRGISAVSMILTTFHRWLQLGFTTKLGETDRDLPCRVLEKAKDLLWLLFQHGLQPENDVLHLCVKQITIMGNILIFDEMFLPMVKDLLVPFFCHGINPNNLEIIHDAEKNIGVPCQLNAHFYLVRAFICRYQDICSITAFFQIYMNTLGQDKLNTLLNGMSKTLQENFEGSEQQIASLKNVEDLKRTVRSLKCLSRISIANALQWRLYDKKGGLPLPKLMQHYLCDL